MQYYVKKKAKCIKVDYNPVLRWINEWNRMILNSRRRWLFAVLSLIPTVNLQIPMPMFPMPPMPGMPPMPPMPGMPGMPPMPPMPLMPPMPSMYGYPPPPPPPPPVGVAFPAPPPIAFQIVEIQDPTKATPIKTETNALALNNENNGKNEGQRERKTIGIAIPMAFPAPVQFAMPAYPPPEFCLQNPRPTSCPVCPPCMCNPCTPAFFSYCSSCHQKCRCRNRNDVPAPLPAGVTYTGHKTHKKVRSDEGNESSDSKSCSSEWSSKKRRRRKKVGRMLRKHFYRRNVRADMGDSDFAKPVLSYISYDGEIKLEKPLSNDEAAELMDEGSSNNQKVQIIAEEDTDHNQRLKILSNTEDGDFYRHRRRQVQLKSGTAQHILGEGKKELVFNPPIDKKISNLSVSFQVTK